MNKLRRKDIEIMAPVGSYESLMAAIQGGAGSVYFGVEHLNMRSRSANNFTLDDLRKIVEIAFNNNVKTYLTLNVEIFDGEIQQIIQLGFRLTDTGAKGRHFNDIAAQPVIKIIPEFPLLP